MKRLIAFLSALLIGISSMGCAASRKSFDDNATNKGYETGVDKSGVSGSKSSEKTISKDKIKIGVLYISDPSEGSGYSYTHDLGIRGMQKNLGLKDSQIEREITPDDDNDAIKASIKKCIDNGCNIIFTTSWGYMDATEEMAKEYPDVYFAHGTGYKSNGSNFTNYFGRIYQVRYLSGIAAGLNTKSNKIGYVAAMGSDNSEVTGGIDAFAIGVESVNPKAEIYVKVTNSWYDPDAEDAAAKTLLQMGCDVMSQHCDTPYPIEEAEKEGAYGIGYNSDMSKECPDTVLTSVIWNWSAYYTSYVNSVIKGTYDGSNYYGGLKDGVVGITKIASFANEKTSDAVKKAESEILKGKCNVFDGELKTNTGETVGSKGSTLDDATITGKLNWYYHNVTVVD